MGSISEKAPPLPVPQAAEVAEGITLLKPLSRLGTGPGLIILVSEDVLSPHEIASSHDGVPWPPMKWAEESYTVIELKASAFSGKDDPIHWAVNALYQCDSCEPKAIVGLIGMPYH